MLLIECGNNRRGEGAIGVDLPMKGGADGTSAGAIARLRRHRPGEGAWSTAGFPEWDEGTMEPDSVGL